MPSLLDAALEYAEKGWPVFPCRPRGKVPLTPRGFKDATTDPAMIRTWWARWPDANIGMPTGPTSGIVVIDIDCGEGKCGDATFAELASGKPDVPRTVESLTGSGGRHLLFRSPDPTIGNTAGKLGKDIDTRGDGGYIVMPPSVHPNGRAYAWAVGKDPRQAALAELPGWLRPLTERTKPETASPPTLRLASPTGPGLGARMKRASAYLAAMPPSISGAGGHSAAFAAATVLVHGFDLPPHIAQNLFATEFNPRCLPEWSGKEIDHKIKEAATKPHDMPKGWLLDETVDASAVAHGAAVATALLSATPKADPEPQQEKPAPAEVGFPAHLLQPPGYVGELCQWINSTAFKPQPVLALANALTFFGAVLGRKVRDPSDLRTNLYCLGVGASGCGKDHSRKAIKRLAHDAGLTDRLMGGEDISSDTAILKAIKKRPSILFQLDEVGHFFASANNRNAQAYQRAIPVTLTKLYSSASTVYLGKEYASEDTERADLDQPCVCLYGTTVPDRLYEGITSSEIRDGFLGRMLVFYSHDPDPDPRDTAPAPTPRPLIEMAQAWFTRDVRSAGAGNIADVTRCSPMSVPAQDDANEVFLAFREQARKARRQAMKRGGGLDSLWSRAEENARKVALVIACGCEFGGPVIGAEVAAWSCDLVAHLVRGLVRSIEHHVSDTEFGRLRLQVLNALRENNGRLTKTQLTRATRGMRGRDRDEVLKELITAGDIQPALAPTNSGPAATVFQLCA